jgi:hypothetical protein
MKPLAVLFLLLAFACVASADDNARKAQEDDIREAVLRDEFEGLSRAGVKPAKVIFISVGEEDSDPSDAFLKRFSNLKSSVRKWSASTGERERGGVKDKATGEKGWLYRAGKITWISDTEVEVPSSMTGGPLYGGGAIRILKKGKGGWKVTGSKKHWVS